MTLLAHVIEQAITCQIVNRQQDHHLVNTTEDIDSIAEILIAIDAAEDPRDRRRLAAQGLRLIAHIRELNDSEHAGEQDIAGAAEHLTPEMLTARRRWTVKRLADELRPLLGDLANPMIRGSHERAKLAWLAQIVREAPPANLAPGSSLEHELGKEKWRILRELLDGAASRLERAA